MPQKTPMPLSKLGDTWREALFVAVLLIIMAPLLLILGVLVFAYALCARVFGPLFGYVWSPKVPRVVGASQKEPIAIYRLYKQKFETLPGVEITEDDTGIRVLSSRAKVRLWCHDEMVGISIDKVYSGMWHSDEYDDLDFCYWIAVGALRDGVVIRKSWLRNNQAWVRSRDMGVWVQTPTEHASYGYVNFRTRGPHR